jgi:ATP-dependent DNA ligase
MISPLRDRWLFKPKYDGFRYRAFRDVDRIEIQSKSRRGFATPITIHARQLALVANKKLFDWPD